MKKSGKIALLLAFLAAPMAAKAAENPHNREVLFGETHLHTVLSFDAYIFGNRNTPEDAYRFAKGETLKHPAGFDMTLSEPLAF